MSIPPEEQTMAQELREMKMQPPLERALRHKDILKAQAHSPTYFTFRDFVTFGLTL